MITLDDWDHLDHLNLQPDFEIYLNKTVSWDNLGRKKTQDSLEST